MNGHSALIKRVLQITLVLMIIPIIMVIIYVALPLFSYPFSDSMAIETLEGRGYIVFAEGEYSSLNTKIDTLTDKVDDIADKADAAVIAAQNAVSAAQSAAGNASAAVVAAQGAATKVDLFNTAERLVYPATTDITCTLTAGDTNAWGNWTQITDSGGGNLTSAFSASTGYITDMQIFDHSAVDKIYLVEVGYGAGHNIIGRVAYHTSFSDNVDIKSELVPVGETVYYRMMCSGANGATARVGFRYIYE